ncbi:sulfur carrier protein ThiS [Gimesia fumaroli]|uniref:Sulfur carrier protein ThiS n=1 Tax=Gimesia fumaroli TaxID=2527976 RepID=A0A518I501_9PLAN|nr:sulfur carrier protein ThiS [Gimesia fumaroli]
MVQIQVNGETQEVPEEFTVAELLAQLGLQPKYLAVERNLILIPREEHAACMLQAGDRLEIVTLVGGG